MLLSPSSPFFSLQRSVGGWEIEPYNPSRLLSLFDTYINYQETKFLHQCSAVLINVAGCSPNRELSKLPAKNHGRKSKSSSISEDSQQDYLWLRWRRSMGGEGPERPKLLGPLTTTDKGEAVIGELVLRAPHPIAAAPEAPAKGAVVLLLVVMVLDVGISTCFLERLRPRCTWRSQYFRPATTSLEHLHFLPSVLRHRPGSGSIAALPQYPDCNTNHTCSYSVKSSLLLQSIAFSFWTDSLNSLR